LVWFGFGYGYLPSHSLHTHSSHVHTLGYTGLPHSLVEDYPRFPFGYMVGLKTAFILVWVTHIYPTHPTWLVTHFAVYPTRFSLHRFTHHTTFTGLVWFTVLLRFTHVYLTTRLRWFTPHPFAYVLHTPYTHVGSGFTHFWLVWLRLRLHTHTHGLHCTVGLRSLVYRVWFTLVCWLRVAGVHTGFPTVPHARWFSSRLFTFGFPILSSHHTGLRSHIYLLLLCITRYHFGLQHPHTFRTTLHTTHTAFGFTQFIRLVCSCCI